MEKFFIIQIKKKYLWIKFQCNSFKVMKFFVIENWNFLIINECKFLDYYFIFYHYYFIVCLKIFQTYAADIFFAQSWKDHRLRLPENMTSDYRLLEVTWLKDIWRPDSFFKNAKSVKFQTMTIPNHYVWLYRDKTILYMVKLVSVNFYNFDYC